MAEIGTLPPFGPTCQTADLVKSRLSAVALLPSWNSRTWADNAITLPSAALTAQPTEQSVSSISDAAIEDLLTRRPEPVLVALQRAQERQQQQLASPNTSVQSVASAVIAGAPKFPVIGNPKATNSIVEFYDYNCGYRKAFHTNAKTAMMNRDTNAGSTWC